MARRRCREAWFPCVAMLGATALVALLPAGCATSGRSAPPAAAISYETALRQGRLAMSHHEYAKAVEELKAAIARRPASPQAHNYLGICHQQLKQYDLAKRNFERAVALDPTFAAAYNNLGSVHTLGGAYEEAVPLFERAITLSPEMPSAHYNLGSALLALGRFEEARASLARAFQLDPNLLESHETHVARVGSLPVPAGDVAFLYASLFAAAGNVEKTVEYLEKARAAGFHDWQRIAEAPEFETVRGDERVKAFYQP